MPSGQGAGTNPIHNKKPKKKAAELDEDDLAHKAKLAADKKAREELAKSVGKGKGPLNTGSQGIKKELIGPKNDPPPAVQEKVLSLIQSWAEAFRGQTELQGVVLVYNELKSKGIEFPNSGSEAMAPIHTPQRSSTAPPPPPPTGATAAPPQPNPNPSSPSTLRSVPRSAIKNAQRIIATPLNLNPEQMAKLKSELDVVQGNMRVFNEMLNELTPGMEHKDDWELLTDLNGTCQSMQTRIVELIEKVANEEVTNELLRINDELNNLFLRYERHAKRHNSSNKLSEKVSLAQPSTQTQPQPPPQVSQKSTDANEPSLIDFTDDTTVTDRLATLQMSSINATVNKPVERNSGDIDFDMFAQSRSATHTESGNNPNVAEGTEGKVQNERDFDEMEKWLKDDPSNEALSPEFDRFLAQRATAGESGPQNGKSNDQKSLI